MSLSPFDSWALIVTLIALVVRGTVAYARHDRRRWERETAAWEQPCHVRVIDR